MSTLRELTGVRIDDVRVSAYEVPTATEQESDGTLVWDSTTLVVVEVSAGGHTGLGYTYCDPSAGAVVQGKLAQTLEDADPLMPQQAWARMQEATRQLGHDGVAAMAVSAVDVALWDLKARLLDVCLADALPRYREGVPIYGSGGFCDYTADQLRDQVQSWMDLGLSSVKIKVGRDAEADPDRVALVRSVVGPDVNVMVDANGANNVPQAVEWAHRYRNEFGVIYFEEPVSSDDLAGLRHVRDHAPPGLAVAAGEYGWNLPYYQRMLDAGAVDILQADVTRCGGITNLLRVDGLCQARCLPFSAHCAPSISAHACCAMETAVHIEYFYDHYRIEGLLFDGTLDPDGGLLTPERGRPGLGLELKRDEARRYEVPLSGSG